MEKSKAAQALGQASAKKRHAGKSKEEVSQYYRDLRLKRKDAKPQIATP